MPETTLVLAGRGKTGRRVAARLAARDLPVRIGSRGGEPPFDWQEPKTWRAALEGVDAVYLPYMPDVAAPEAAYALESFTALAVHSGVRRIVALSRRGEPAAERCDAIVRSLPIDWTLLRASWLAQSFSESWLLTLVLRGQVTLPLDDAVREPFVDADDVAEVAVAALTGVGHARQVYDLTGPRLWSFRQAVDEIARVARRRIRYVEVPFEEFVVTLAADLPPGSAELTAYLFGELLAGRSETVATGVMRALGRTPRDFGDYVRDVATTGLWNIGISAGGAPRPDGAQEDSQ